MPMYILFATVALSSLIMGVGHAASFDCAKAQSAVEKLICADPVLSQLDVDLARYYSVAQDQLKSGASCLRSDQREWLKAVRNQCRDASCLKRTQLLRLAALERFQPGVSSVRWIELPRAPVLLWIFAPGKDELALPQGTSTPFQAQGVYQNDPLHGPSLRTDAGEIYILTSLMSLEDISLGELDTLLQSRGRIEARGRLMDRKPEKSGYLDPARAPAGALDSRQCVFVYSVIQ